MLVIDFIDPFGVEKQIRIKLLDKPWVEQWKNYVFRLYDRVPYLKISLDHTIWNSMYHSAPATQLLGELKDALVYFNDKFPQYDFSYGVTEIDKYIADPQSITQPFLNYTHRCFTTVAKDFYDRTIVVPEGIARDDVFHPMHVLNDNTHRLECISYKKAPRRIACEHGEYFTFTTENINSAMHKQNDKSPWETNGVELLNTAHEFDYINEDYHHNVWLNEDIQGKDQFKCWLDEDDASQDDITGNLLVTPNLIMDRYGTLTGILDNPDFQEQYRKLNKKLNRFPIGDIDNVDEVNWEVDLKYSEETCNIPKMKSITLCGRPLWKYE